VLPVATATTDSVTDEPLLREIAARLFVEADWSEREPVTLGNNPYKVALGKIIVEKHRQMGRKLQCSDR